MHVYGCLAVGLGIAILVGMWPCMYADVNECNVCSVCIFLIWDFGFTVSYCEGCENGFARSKACHSYNFFFFFLCSISFCLINLGFVDFFVLFDFCSFGLWFVFLVLISLCVLWFDFSWV